MQKKNLFYDQMRLGSKCTITYPFEVYMASFQDIISFGSKTYLRSASNKAWKRLQNWRHHLNSVSTHKLPFANWPIPLLTISSNIQSLHGIAKISEANFWQQEIQAIFHTSCLAWTDCLAMPYRHGHSHSLISWHSSVVPMPPSKSI